MAPAVKITIPSFPHIRTKLFANAARVLAENLIDLVNVEVGRKAVSLLGPCSTLYPNCSPSFSPYQCHYFCANVGEFVRSNHTPLCSFSNAPVETLYLIRQHGARRRTGNKNLKGIILNLCRHRTTDHQAGLRVVGGWAEHKGRPMSPLFVSSLRCEVEPYDVTGIWYVPRHDYQTSLPWGGPKSTALCRFFEVIPLSSSSMSYVF